MRKPKIRLIKGTRTNGCALACLAMVLGKTEDEIDRDFGVDFNRKGVSPQIIKDYLIDSGLSVIEKTVGSFIDKRKHNKRMLTPFAQAHIVIVQSRVDSKENHAFVMTSTGNILDPAETPYEQHYYVIDVLGVFWD